MHWVAAAARAQQRQQPPPPPAAAVAAVVDAATWRQKGVGMALTAQRVVGGVVHKDKVNSVTVAVEVRHLFSEGWGALGVLLRSTAEGHFCDALTYYRDEYHDAGVLRVEAARFSASAPLAPARKQVLPAHPAAALSTTTTPLRAPAPALAAAPHSPPG